MRIKDISVHLRQRELTTGRVELTFDYCVNGKRIRRTTGLFLEPAKNRQIKTKNDQTMLLAQEKRKMLEDTLNGRVEEDNFNTSFLFFDWFESCMNKRNGKTKSNWKTTQSNLLKFEPDKNITIGEITRMWADRYVSYLRKSSIANNTQVGYCRIITACLNEAVESGIIKSNPFKKVKKPRIEDAQKNYLTNDELKILSATSTKYKTVKQTFLFSCMTGLRYSDIVNIKWKNIIQNQEGGYSISFSQVKTHYSGLVPINASAISLLGERGDEEDHVFKNVPCCSRINQRLSEWVKSAGIKKHITFHCSRHTFATLLLSKTNNIYMVSNLLGHTKIETTMIYAKLVDSDKTKAVNLIDNLF